MNLQQRTIAVFPKSRVGSLENMKKFGIVLLCQKVKQNARKEVVRTTCTRAFIAVPKGHTRRWSEKPVVIERQEK